MRGEVIGLACSGNPFLCPVKAIVHWVLYLRSRSVPPDTPLSQPINTPARVTAVVITSTIKDSVGFLGPELGFLLTDVSVHCLRAAEATVLLLAQVDPDIICLTGCWRSDEKLLYLHVPAYGLMKDYSRQMLLASNYTLIPNQQLVPQQ